MNASATRMFRRPMIGVVAAPRVGVAVPCVNGTAPRPSVCRKEGQDFADLFTVEKNAAAGAPRTLGHQCASDRGCAVKRGRIDDIHDRHPAFRPVDIANVVHGMTSKPLKGGYVACLSTPAGDRRRRHRIGHRERSASCEYGSTREGNNSENEQKGSAGHGRLLGEGHQLNCPHAEVRVRGNGKAEMTVQAPPKQSVLGLALCKALIPLRFIVRCKK